MNNKVKVTENARREIAIVAVGPCEIESRESWLSTTTGTEETNRFGISNLRFEIILCACGSELSMPVNFEICSDSGVAGPDGRLSASWRLIRSEREHVRAST